MNDTRTLIQSSIISLIIVMLGLFMLCMGGAPRINYDTPLIEAEGFEGNSGEMSDDEFLSLLETGDDAQPASDDAAASSEEDDLFSALLADDSDDNNAADEGDEDLAELLALLEADDATPAEKSDDSQFDDLLAADDSESTPSANGAETGSSDDADDLGELEALLSQMDEESESTTASEEASSPTSDNPKVASIELEIQRLEDILSSKDSKIDSIKSEIFKFDEQIAQMEADESRPKGQPAAGAIQYASYESGTSEQSMQKAEASSINADFGDVGSVQETYDMAMNYFQDRQYKMAIAAFEAVLIEQPQGRLADNCQYWLGESYFGMGKYYQAIVEFEKVFSFDSADKRDDAQIMMGIANMKAGLVDLARNDFTWLLACYNGSEYSNKARYYMNQL